MSSDPNKEPQPKSENTPSPNTDTPPAQPTANPEPKPASVPTSSAAPASAPAAQSTPQAATPSPTNGNTGQPTAAPAATPSVDPAALEEVPESLEEMDLTKICIWGDPKNDRDRLIAQSFVFSGYIMGNARRFLSGLVPKRILDVGCGEGQLTQVFSRLYPDAEVIGIDIDPKAIEVAKAKQLTRPGFSKPIQFMTGNIEEKLPDGPFDLIYTSMVMLHLMQPAKVISMMKDALSPGGWVWIKDIDPAWIETTEHPHWKKLGQLLLSAAVKTGRNAAIGALLEGLVKEAGFDKVRLERENFTYQNSAAQSRVILSVGLGVFNNTRHMVSKLEGIPLGEIERMVNELNQAALTLKGRVSFVNVLGQKPKSTSSLDKSGKMPADKVEAPLKPAPDLPPAAPGGKSGGRPPQVFSDQPLDESKVPDTNNLYVFGNPQNDRDRLIAQSYAFAQYIRSNSKRFIRKEPTRILDVGCGDGQLSLVFNRIYPKAKIVGIDKDPLAIETANKLQERAAGITGKIDYRAMDAEQELPEGPFDLIYISMMLLHTRNPRKVLEMAYERLAPGGYIWIRELVTDWATAVNHPNWERLAGLVVSTMTKAGFHPVLGTELKQMLSDVGFTEVKVESEVFRPNDGTPTGQIIISLGLSVFYNALKFISMMNNIPEAELLKLHEDLSKDALKLKGRLNFPNFVAHKPKGTTPLDN